MDIKTEWKVAYGRQRVFRGEALYVARSQVVTEALRRVMPPVRRIVGARMNSGTPASYMTLEPPR